MDTTIQDVRFAIVTIRRTPGFAATALVTLALGIGSTTALFSVVNPLLLRPLPYPDSDRLVRLWEEHPGGRSPAGNRWLSNRTYEAWTDGARTLEAVGAHATYDFTVLFGSEPARLTGSELSPVVFDLLRARPALGRLFLPGEGAQRVVVLSDRLWRERFGADAAAVGRTLTIEGRPHDIVGVARPELHFPDRRVLFWIPSAIPSVAAQPERTAAFTAIGRLEPGVTPAQAEAEGTARARTMPRPLSADLFFGKGGPVVVHARPLADDMTALVRPALIVLAASVALVLLIACANVANLLLSRGLAREREIAIRAAIGASWSRLVRQLLTESALLATAGGALGLLLAWILVRLVPLAAPERLPRLEEVRLDASVVVFAVAISMFAALASGLAPALRAARLELCDAFRGGEGGHAGTRGPRARRLGDALLVAEAAFAVMLAVGAALLAHSFVRLVRVDPGYTASRVLTARVLLPRDAPPERTGQLIDAALARLRAMPGVDSAGAGNMMPLVLRTAISAFRLPGAGSDGRPASGRAVTYVVTPGYAETLGLRLKAGRFFTDADVSSATRAMIVNEEFVRQYLPAGAVGARIEDMFLSDAGTITEVVGVVANVLKDGNDTAPQPELYFAHGSDTRRIIGFANLVVRTTGDPGSLAAPLRALVREIDRGAVVDRIDPLTRLVWDSVEEPRFAAVVLSSFAGLALTLASIGLYGVLSYSVAQRRRELGLRAALGAGSSRLVALVLREGLSVTAAGAALGTLGAVIGSRYMAGVLFGIAPLDPAAFTIAPALLVLVALAACLPPALRAASADPSMALRQP
jgi:putative ABC transport system permease protein